MAKQKLYYVILIIKCIIFGLTLVFIKKLLENMTVMDILAYRFLFSALTFEILRWCKVIKVDFRNKKLYRLFPLALIQPVLYYIFETIGISFTSTLVSGVMLSLVPVFIAIFSYKFLNEKTTFMQNVSIIGCVLGVVLISAMTSLGTGGTNSLIGIIIVFLAVICEASYTVISKKSSQQFTSIEITYVMMIVAAIIFNLINGVMKFNSGEILNYFEPLKNFDNIICFLYLGVIATCYGYLSYNFLISKMQASRVSVFSGLTTVVTILAGVIFQKEEFLWFHFIGSVIIILGVVGTNYFKEKKVE